MLMIKVSAARLGELLAKAKHGPLESAERSELEKLRRELTDGFVFAQKLTLAPGWKQRRSRRVAHVLKLTLAGTTFAATTVTMNLSSGGFAALLADTPERGERVEFALKTKLGPLTGKAHVVAIMRRERAYLVSFAIDEMEERSREALEFFVLERIVADLAKRPPSWRPVPLAR